MENRKRSTLHVHSMYSRYDSVQTPDDIVKRAKELGIENITLTDHGTMLGIETFMDAGKKYGINTIPGVETYTEDRCHLILIARNYHGYQLISYAMRDANTNILKTKSNLDYPIMTYEMMEKYFKGSDDVIATSACVQGPLGHILLSNARAQGQNQKLMSKLEKNQESYRAFLDADAHFSMADDSISRLKDMIGEAKPKTRKTFINSAQKKLKKAQALNDDDPSKEEMMRNAEKDIKAYEDALASVEGWTKQIEELNKEKKKYSSLRSKNRSSYKNYCKIKDEADAIAVFSDDQLYSQALDRLAMLKKIFRYFFIELQYHGLQMEADVMPKLARMAAETGTPVIAANDAHVPVCTDEALEARRIVRFNYFNKAQEITDADRELYIKTDEELSDALMKILPEETVSKAIANTSVLDSCRVVFPEGKHYPSIKPENMTPDQYFMKLLADARAEKIREGSWTPVYQQRLEHEISVIRSMGFVDYHLVVRDFCIAGRKLGKIPKNRIGDAPETYEETLKWIEKEGFDVGTGIGPGRGSACGSLVCYLLGITGIDPIKYDLLFERFLNPERVTMPDIDTDVATSIRPLVIRYIKERYGERAVCSIATVNTYSAKSAVQMAGRDRASQLYQHLEKKKCEAKKREYLHAKTYPVSDLVPEAVGVTLDGCEAEVLPEIQNDPEKMLIWKRAKLIEGRLSGTGVHAGGVIISDNDNVNDYIPLAYNPDKAVWVAQCEKERAEEKGMLKMDLLGLNTLDIISDALELIKETEGYSIDVSNLPMEKEIFEEIYAKGRTNNIFQFESDGMKSMLKRFKPECFDDIILLNAAFRPGPIQYLDGIIEVKSTGHARESCLTQIPQLKEILAPTYMSIIYQEQVMQIFQKLAGYSLGGADMVRRYMSKKKTEKLKKERKAFIYGDKERGIKGCIANGISGRLADELFDQMTEFAKYAFNKSHACAYSYNSYITAYLAYHFPVQYITALFNNTPRKKFGKIEADCHDFGVTLLPPDISHSSYDFTIESVEEKTVRFGLRGINGIGEANISFANQVRSEANANGPFKSPKDFLSRCLIRTESEKGIKYSTPEKGLMIPLIGAGAFDEYGYSRTALSEAFNKAMSYVDKDEEKAKEKILNRIKEKQIIETCEEENKIALDIQYTEMILASDPLKKYSDDRYYNSISDIQDEPFVRILGVITKAEIGKNSKGRNVIKMEIFGEGGKCTARSSYEFYQRYAMHVESLLYRPFEITGRAFKGMLFASAVKIPAVPESYSLMLKTVEDFDAFGNVIRSVNDFGNISLTVVSSFTRVDGKAVPIRAKAVNMQISLQTFRAITDAGLRPKLWSTRKCSLAYTYEKEETGK